MLKFCVASAKAERQQEVIKLNTKTRNMVGIGLFTAIVVVLQLVSMQLRFSMFSITLTLVPIVVGAALYGWQAGAWLGGVFGVAVLLTGDAAAFYAVNPLATILVVLVKGVGCGCMAGLMYRLLSRLNRVLAVVTAAVVCPLTNTGIFLLGCKLFFMPTITQWGQAMGFESVGAYMIFGLVGINFLIELGTNILLAPVTVRLIRLGRK